MANVATQRIISDIADIQRGKEGKDLSLAVAQQDSDVRKVRALIVGPPDTPYEYGFFEFELKYPKNYPHESPACRATTTNRGRTRFNPNIYAEGKVCLSILGTWRGQPDEEWSSAQSTQSLLLSIQSLMSSNPYENEPGYENTKRDDPSAKAYVEKIRHETLRVAVIQRLETLLGISNDPNAFSHTPKRPRTDGSFTPYTNSDAKSPDGNGASGPGTPETEASAFEYDADATFAATDDDVYWEPFGDLLKRRFLWYYEHYVRAIEEGAKKHKKGEPFTRMEFEYPPNSMEGSFDYPGLRKRLDQIKQALDDEVEQWAIQGMRQVHKGTQLATQLKFQFTQLEHKWNATKQSTSANDTEASDDEFDAEDSDDDDDDGEQDESDEETDDDEEDESTQSPARDPSATRLEISLPDPQNPFLWHLTLFGRSSTNLEGGIWNMSLHIPPSFPESQPRVRVHTPIFHHRVSSSTGTLCYLPKNVESIDSHLEAIVAVFDDRDLVLHHVEAKFDPRANVNPEAFALYWGGADKRKLYARKLRRSAQESCEFA